MRSGREIPTEWQVTSHRQGQWARRTQGPGGFGPPAWRMPSEAGKRVVRWLWGEIFQQPQ